MTQATPTSGHGDHLVVVLPVYNEADSIAHVLAEVREASDRLLASGVRTSVVIVDDDSPDGTADVAAEACNRLGLALDVTHGERIGLGDAMLRGLSQALDHNPTAIVTLDGDGQHNPFDIPTLYRAFRARHADIAIGSRWTRGGSAPGTSHGRAVGSRAGNWMFRMVTGTRGVRDATTSFRVYSPAAVRFLLATDSRRYGGYSFFSTTIALAEAAGYTLTEVPIEFRPRFSGQSKLNRKEVWKYFASLGQLRAERRNASILSNTHDSYQATAEIELLSQAATWNRFVIDATFDRLSSSPPDVILEVGAGRGGITTALRERFPNASIVAIEPDRENHSRLVAAFRRDPFVTPFHGTLSEYVDQHRPSADLVLYVNVLEHIMEDGLELKTGFEAMRPGGMLAIFVPALQSIYGPIDAKSGHFRRYTLDSVRSTVAAAGFEVHDARYVERLGVAPYWLNYRLLNKSTIPGTSIGIFDRIYVPVMKATERILRVLPFGKNVTCIGVRPPC